MIQDIVQEISDIANDKVNEIHTAFPGKIVEYDAEKGTATVLPIMKYKLPDGNKIDYPQLTEVPVWVHQSFGQKAQVSTPIKKDDECIVVVFEQSLDLWKEAFDTDTDLRFDLSNAICIPGLFAKPNNVTKRACEDNAIIIETEGTYIEVKKEEIEINTGGSRVEVTENEVAINGSNVNITGNVTVTGDFTVTGGIVNLN